MAYISAIIYGGNKKVSYRVNFRLDALQGKGAKGKSSVRMDAAPIACATTQGSVTLLCPKGQPPVKKFFLALEVASSRPKPLCHIRSRRTRSRSAYATAADKLTRSPVPALLNLTRGSL